MTSATFFAILGFLFILLGLFLILRGLIRFYCTLRGIEKAYNKDAEEDDFSLVDSGDTYYTKLH
jgi:hypothetical protein